MAALTRRLPATFTALRGRGLATVFLADIFFLLLGRFFATAFFFLPVAFFAAGFFFAALVALRLAVAFFFVTFFLLEAFFAVFFFFETFFFVTFFLAGRLPAFFLLLVFRLDERALTFRDAFFAVAFLLPVFFFFLVAAFFAGIVVASKTC